MDSRVLAMAATAGPPLKFKRSMGGEGGGFLWGDSKNERYAK